MSKDSAQTLSSAFSLKKNIRHLFIRSSAAMKPVDGLRAISMLMVLCFHSFLLLQLSFPESTYLNLLENTPSYLHWAWNGDKGVDVFFVISGFLISFLLFKEHQSKGDIKLKQFYLRRFLRLTPVYLFALLIFAIGGGSNIENIWANLLYVNNFLPMNEMFMPWSWSLAVEEQFYILFPVFLLYFFSKSDHKIRWLIVLFLLSFLIRGLVLYSNETLWTIDYAQIYLDRNLFNLAFSVYYDNLYTRYGNFIVGIFVAYLFTHHHQQVKQWLQSSRWPEVITLLSVLVIAYTMSSTLYNPYYDASLFEKNFKLIALRNVFGAAVGWLILTMLYPSGLLSRLLSAFFSLRFWYPLAQLSYSMYLFHIMLLPLVFLNVKANLNHYNVDYTIIPAWWVLCIAGLLLLVTIFVSTLTYLFIERPFMNLRYLVGKPSVAPATAH